LCRRETLRLLLLSQGKLRHFALLAQILRWTESVWLRITIQLSERWRNRTWRKRSGFSGIDSGMQKDGLTMFPPSCYICKVPRVNPGLLCAVSSSGGVRELAVELLRNAFLVK
jgi:hypothetical protein